MSNKPPKHSEVKKKESTAKRMRASWGEAARRSSLNQDPPRALPHRYRGNQD